MDDVSIVRAQDLGANTARHIIEAKPDIRIPTLKKLGLIGAIHRGQNGKSEAVFGTANLAHHGADSFLGHQEIMGTTPKEPLNEPFNHVIDDVHSHLMQAGYHVRKVSDGDGPAILVVNECATVGDNLETDLGQVYNVSACLDAMPFSEAKKTWQDRP